MMRLLVWVVFCLFSITGFSKAIVTKNISYVPGSTHKRHLLDVYASSKQKASAPVLIFIHGGSWNSGSKDIYKFFGRGFAEKGVVTVIINYRLTPEATYMDMASDCASAVKWVKDHIREYGGDTSLIYLSGHSAGGHLAALISNDQTYLASIGIVNLVKGCILIDAFGLDMDQYLSTSDWKGDSTFKVTFSNNPATWKKASPFYYLNASSVPQIILIGGKTYSSISKQSDLYFKALKEKGIEAQFEVVKKKRHIGMIFQFINKSNHLYEKVIQFVNS